MKEAHLKVWANTVLTGILLVLVTMLIFGIYNFKDNGKYIPFTNDGIYGIVNTRTGEAFRGSSFSSTENKEGYRLKWIKFAKPMDDIK